MYTIATTINTALNFMYALVMTIMTALNFMYALAMTITHRKFCSLQKDMNKLVNASFILWNTEVYHTAGLELKNKNRLIRRP